MVIFNCIVLECILASMWIVVTIAVLPKPEQNVLIIAHVPPGMFELGEGLAWFYASYNKKYLEVLERYSDVIIAQLYGHEHTDSLRVQFENEGRAIGSLFLSPAVTPWKSTIPGAGANNPSIRLFQYDRGNGALKKYIQYYLNLTLANIKADPDIWEKEYDTSDVYAIDELKPTEVHTLIKGFSDKGNKLFHHYLDYNSVKWNVGQKCNEMCVTRHICAMSQLDFDNYKTCIAGGMTTKHPHSTTRHPQSTPMPRVPMYMYYVVGGLGGVLFIMFLIVGFMCFSKRRRMSAPRYAKFGSLTVNS